MVRGPLISVYLNSLIPLDPDPASSHLPTTFDVPRYLLLGGPPNVLAEQRSAANAPQHTDVSPLVQLARPWPVTAAGIGQQPSHHIHQGKQSSRG